MNTDLQIRSPYTAPPQARPTPRRETQAEVPSDGYAGTVSIVSGGPMTAVAPQNPAKSFASRLAIVGLGALALVGVAGAVTLTAAPAQAQTVQTVQQQTYSNPSRALPDNAANVDDNAWAANSDKAFTSIKRGDTSGFLQSLSADGVWVRGLPEAPKTETGMLHMTRDEMAKDLKSQGPFYQHVFGRHDNARLVVTPDAQGHVQTILLD